MSYYLETPYQVDIEVDNTKCKCSNSLKEQGISQYQIIDVRGTDSSKARHFIIIRKEQVKKISQNAVCNIEMWFYTSNGVCVNTTISEPPYFLTGYDINNFRDNC